MKLTDNLYFYPEQGMLDCNTYVIMDGAGMLIDAGFVQFLPALVKDMRQDGLKPENISIITNTHLHVDHYWANQAFKEISGANILAHPLQRKFYDVTVIQTSEFFGLKAIDFTEDGYLDDVKLKVGGVEIELISAPGHSPDSVCFYAKEQKALVCGDVLFDGNTGRADLPGGNADALKKSIESLSQLDINYLLPGHMGILRDASQVKRNFDLIRENVFRWL
ncbi:MAG: MBL fold metallo-hydrolase [Chloroflexi bacterium]|nr:MBL fold metallo-hydrolase [Chloroflexota bacterium]